MMKPGGKIMDAIGFGIWALAAGNIMVYTVQCFIATRESLPLVVWQNPKGNTSEGESGETAAQVQKKIEELAKAPLNKNRKPLGG